MYTSTIIKCLEQLFTLCGVPSCLLSENARTFTSSEFKMYLLERLTASNHSTVYHPTANSQVERYNGVIWRAIRLVLKLSEWPINQWEHVFALCVALNDITFMYLLLPKQHHMSCCFHFIENHITVILCQCG